MKDTPECRKLKRLIRRHVNAQIDLYMKGGGCPEDFPQIDAEAKEAWRDLKQFIEARI